MQADQADTRHAQVTRSVRISPGPLSSLFAAERARAQDAAMGLWRRDPAVWSTDAAVQRTISNRLGWMTAPSVMAPACARMQAFAKEIRDEGFTDVVLLGMGGSSLAPEVLRRVIGPSAGWPRVHMLDSTDPGAVRAVSPPLDRTLFLLASKSGGTIEPNSLAAHYLQALEASGVKGGPGRFVAITDEGTSLAARAASEGFREVFINPSDIGGRYSALSFFGLVPAALMGQNITELISWGEAVLTAAAPSAATETETNPAIDLGLFMGVAARAGRDKLTLLLPPSLEPFGLWVEQLVAESTGKAGVGIVPIAGEQPGRASSYREDRAFVSLQPGGAEADSAISKTVHELIAAGVPVAEIDFPTPAALGAEFMRWEIATAVAGALLGINPFDEPNVSQAKEATTRLLAEYTATGSLPRRKPDVTRPDGSRLSLSSSARETLARTEAERILSLVGPGDYVAILAYVGPDASLAAAFDALRTAIRDRTGAATMFGYGPRYLHSTGQLHKGGPNTGVFVLMTATPHADVPIPGQPYSFGTLEMAQALGDFASLDETRRRAIHIHLPAPDAALVKALGDAMLPHARQR